MALTNSPFQIPHPSTLMPQLPTIDSQWSVYPRPKHRLSFNSGYTNWIKLISHLRN